MALKDYQALAKSKLTKKNEDIGNEISHKGEVRQTINGAVDKFKKDKKAVKENK